MTAAQPGAGERAIPWALLYGLRDSNLLSEGQLEEILQRGSELDLPGLAALVVEKEWLTPYQWKRILAGEGRGLILGQYRILDELGEGGFGRVYKAVHSLMNRLAAIKIIDPRCEQSVEARELFLREVVATTRLAHPNIALVYEANQAADCLWFAMEYVDGPTLEDLAAAHGPLPIPFVCAVIRQVARALQFAHENGIIHRDVKPANLLLPGAGSVLRTAAVPAEPSGVLVKVVDFGLARLIPRGNWQPGSICADGSWLGTPEYLSPEQARNSHEVDGRSDLYSLGCTFYYALTARPPFRGVTPMDTLTQHLEKEAEPLSVRRAGVPPDVVDIVQRLMAKKPEQRFATAADLIEALNFTLANLCREKLAHTPNALSHPAAPQAREPVPPPAEAPARAGENQEAAGGDPRTPEAQCSSPGAPSPQETVPALWREWRAVVEALAHGRPSGWSEEEYGGLYAALREGLRNPPGPPADPRSQRFARVDSLVEPWLKLRALAALDRQTLAGLGETCRHLDAQFAGAPRFPVGVWVVLAGVLFGIGAFVSYLFLAGGL